MDFNQMKDQVTNAPDVSDMFAQEDIQQNKVFAILPVLFPILFWLPLVAKPESGFCKFYANQTLIYFVLAIVLNIVNLILGAILGLIPLIGGLLAGLVGLAVAVCIMAAWIFLLVNAASGKAKALPFVGNLFTAFK